MQTLDIVRTSRVCITVSNILQTPLVFISGYANTENVSYSLTAYRWFNKAVFTLYRIAFFLPTRTATRYNMNSYIAHTHRTSSWSDWPTGFGELIPVRAPEYIFSFVSADSSLRSYL